MRWLVPGLALATVLAALAFYQGMVTAGLVPLAVFGPVYALARSAGLGSDVARRHAARVTVAASAALGLAFLPALGQAPVEPPAWATIGVTLTAAGAGALAGFAAADHRSASDDADRRWSFVHAMRPHHARGLAMLAGVAVLAGTLVALLREAPIARLDGAARTLPDAVFGRHAVDGALALPDPAGTVVLAVPLSLAPLALGFLTSPKRSAPLGLGGLAVLLLAPLVVTLDVPVRASTGAWVPISVLDQPGLAVPRALAPSALGLLVAGGLAYTIKEGRLDPSGSRVAWALATAPLAALLWGPLPGTVVALGVVSAGLIATVATGRAPFGLAVLIGGLAGGGAQLVLGLPSSWALGALVGVAAGGAAGTLAASEAIEVPGEGLRSPWTLISMLVALAGVGTLVGLAPELATDPGPFPAPHARGLLAALTGLLEARGLLLIVWGLIAGGLIEALAGRAAWIALGALAGPGIALLVLVGSLLRALWEKGLLARAREGYVMRGQLGYELLRVHVLVIGALAGETLAIGIAGVLG